MRIEDRIALGCNSESVLADVDHETLVRAKSSGPQVLAHADSYSREGGLYWFVLSTEKTNRRGDIIRQSGLDFRNWEKTPVVLHNHDDEFPVGLGVIRRESARTLMGVQFSQVLPRAKMLNALLDEGMPMAASITIMPQKVHDPRSQAERESLGLGKWGVVYETAEVYEGSIVSVPADPAAVRNAIRSVASESDVDRFVAAMQPTEMDLVRRLRAERSAPVVAPAGDAPAWLERFEAALDRATARIEHAVRGGARREPEGSHAIAPVPAKGVLSELVRGLGSEVDKRIPRKDAK